MWKILVLEVRLDVLQVIMFLDFAFTLRGHAPALLCNCQQVLSSGGRIEKLKWLSAPQQLIFAAHLNVMYRPLIEISGFFCAIFRYPRFPGFTKNWVFAISELDFWKFGTEFR